jgi:hypothetical protein
VKITTASRDIQADAFGGSFDTTCIIEVRTGAAPTNAGDALTGTVLATISCGADAFAAASGGAAAKNGTWQDASADASGTAGYAVMRKSGDPAGADNTVPRALFTVSASGGGGEIEFQNLNIAVTQQVTITSFTVTQPAS